MRRTLWRRLVSRAEQQRLDLVSLMVLLQANSFAERLLIPPVPLLFPEAISAEVDCGHEGADSGRGGRVHPAAANALERIGGFAAIRGEVIDDCALARAVKRSGGRDLDGAYAEERQPARVPDVWRDS